MSPTDSIKIKLSMLISRIQGYLAHKVPFFQFNLFSWKSIELRSEIWDEIPLPLSFLWSILLQEDDVTGSLKLLKLCAKYYREGQLTAQCGSGRCPEVPDVCSQHNAIHTIFHYLTDQQFSKQQVSRNYWQGRRPVPAIISYQPPNHHPPTTHQPNQLNNDRTSAKISNSPTLFPFSLLPGAPRCWITTTILTRRNSVTESHKLSPWTLVNISFLEIFIYFFWNINVFTT